MLCALASYSLCRRGCPAASPGGCRCVPQRGLSGGVCPGLFAIMTYTGQTGCGLHHMFCIMSLFEAKCTLEARASVLMCSIPGSQLQKVAADPLARLETCIALMHLCDKWVCWSLLDIWQGLKQTRAAAAAAAAPSAAVEFLLGNLYEIRLCDCLRDPPVYYVLLLLLQRPDCLLAPKQAQVAMEEVQGGEGLLRVGSQAVR